MTKQKRKRQPKEFYERPLTPEEAQFAAEHLNFVYWFLNQQKLNLAEWFDIVIFRYLLAVKKYVSIPDLQRYPFAGTAYKAMASAVANEFKSQKRRIQTVSLYDPVPGIDGLVYADTITTENLSFAPYIYEEDEAVRISTPKVGGRPKGKESTAIEKFLASDAENMRFEYDTAKEVRSKINTIISHRNRLAKCHIYYEAHLCKNRIYITKTTKKEAATS